MSHPQFKKSHTGDNFKQVCCRRDGLDSKHRRLHKYRGNLTGPFTIPFMVLLVLDVLVLTQSPEWIDNQLEPSLNLAQVPF